MRRSESREPSLSDPSTAYLVACGGDTVKVFDLTTKSGDPCTLSYTPTPGSQVNTVKWNHTNLVVASAGDDKKISLWRKNGKSMGTLHPSRKDANDLIDESISAINFCNKGSRYLCSGGTGRIVKIWDLQKRLCIKKLSGHTDTVTGVMYNCKDEHLASISLKGDLILHNLASGLQAAELKDPNGQALRVLDYSRFSRHILVTAGDDGSVHLWDTTGRNPKVSWLKQHSAPTTGVCFSPSSDKIIASVGLDKKLYTFDSANKRPTYCASYEAPFSSLVFRDDGYILAAGTSTGRVVFYDVRGKPQPLTALLAYHSSEAVASLSWQRSKTELLDEYSCTDEIALLGSTGEESILMPDPLPSASAFSFSAENTICSSSSLTTMSRAVVSTKYSSASEETPLKDNILPVGSLSRLHAPRTGYTFKDDMAVFSPLVDVQPITPSLSNLWDDQDEDKKDNLHIEKRTSLFSSSSRKFPLTEPSMESHPISDWRLNPTPIQEDASSTLLQSSVTPVAYIKTEPSFSPTPPEAWGGNAFADKLSRSEGIPSLSRALPAGSASSGPVHAGLQDLPASTSHALKSSLSSSSLILTNQQDKSYFMDESQIVLSDSSSFTALSVPFGQKTLAAQADAPFPLSTIPRKFSTYAERISTTCFSDGKNSAANSPKAKKTGLETRTDHTTLFSRLDSSGAMGMGMSPSVNGTALSEPLQDLAQSTDQQKGISSFSLQLVQRTLEESLGSIQKSIHDDVKNLHIELLRQFHMQEMEMSNLLNTLLEKQDELMKEVQSLRRENQQLRQLL